MSILITGSGTLVGKSISSYLSSKFKIISTYRSTFPYNLSKLKNIKIKKLDLEKEIKLNIKFNSLIHCASAIPDYKISKKKYFQVNIYGFRKILKLCKKNNVKYIVLLSTVSVYGKIKNHSVNEKTPIKVKEKDDPYGFSKSIMEKDLINYAKKEKIKFVILRLPAVIGKNSDHNFLSNLIKNIIFHNKKSFNLKNSNFKLNNFVHTKTLSKIIDYCIKKNIEGIFILGSKNPLKFKNIIKKISFYKKIKVDYENDNSAFNIDIKKALHFKLPVNKTTNEVSLFLEENFNKK